ncbi:MAG: hypothetical protein QOE54_3084 [Streptosporangiaceae bacterium]|jgi:uncharacterized OB-fold protein|nr:hypothetical protein [Streptosporangiaceae bacterium]MDX6430718.1 hypothetical protein [Streptosporangiaceae bacterium]
MARPENTSNVVSPLVGRDDARFWEGVTGGRLRLERCAACGRLRHPPGPMCPVCGSLDTEVFEPEPYGSLLSWILPRHPPAALPEQEVIVLVELECGARLVSNLRGVAPAEIRQGMPVEIFFDTLDGVVLPQARPHVTEGS